MTIRESQIFSLMSPRLPTNESTAAGHEIPTSADSKPVSPALSNELPSTPEHEIEPSLNSMSDDNIAVSEEEGELVIDQPVDFSYAAGKQPGVPNQTKESQTKPKKSKPKSLESLKMSAPIMGTWEETLEKLAKAGQGSPKEKVGSQDENKDPANLSLAAPNTNMGMNIAAQLQKHFLESLPTQSYAWLNGMGSVPPNTPQEGEKIRERVPLGGIK